MPNFVKDTAEFDDLVKGSTEYLLVVDFTATWCGPCQIIAPTFAELSEKYKKHKFIKVDVDEAEEIAAKCGISAMPTFIFFKGGKRVETFSGADPKRLKELVKKHAK